MKNAMLSLVTFLLIIQQDVLSQNYALPFKGDDLKPFERVYTGDHSPGDPQGEGEDLNIMRYIGNNKWSFHIEGTHGTKNTDWVISRKPVYAMADGKVVGCWCNVPENPRPRRPTDTEAGGEWLHPKLVSKEMPRGGNLLWVEHPDGTRALYAHMIPGTIPDNLCANKAVFFPDLTNDENIYVILPV